MTLICSETADELLLSLVNTSAGLQDPYPIYEQLRSGPARWLTKTGSVVLTHYADCMEALRNPRLGRAEPDMELPPTFGREQRRRDPDTVTMLFLNPPDHTRIRSLVSREFTPRRVEHMRADIESILAPDLELLRRDGGGDVMTQVAVPFPVAVISELLGVPHEGNEHIRPLVRAMTSLIDAAADGPAREAGLVAAMDLAIYFADLIEAKRATPDDKLLSALVGVEAEGDRLSPEELIANTLLLYAAGFETTSNLIGNGLRLLVEHPDQMELLRTHPDLTSSAVLEMLRHDSPVQLNVRFALDEVELFGERFERGTEFVVLQGSANHDAAAYTDPSVFDVRRFTDPQAPQPLSFGWGAHHCLGAHLARAEGEIFFSSLLGVAERIAYEPETIAGGGPRYRPSFTLRGLESLPVRLS
ncbi:MAG: cytochrome P450 [Microthrixaceae bacterium]